MKNKTIWIVGIVALVLAALVWWGTGMQTTPGNMASTTPTTTGTQTGQPNTPGQGTGSSGTGAQGGTLKSFSTPFGFSFQYPSTLLLETSGLDTGGFKEQGARGVAAVHVQMGTVVERLLMSVSSELSDVGTCAQTWANTTSATIGGKIYTVSKTSTNEDGTYTDTTVYQIRNDKTCYEIRDTVTYGADTHLTAAEIEQQRANKQATAALASTVIQSYRLSY